MSSIVIPVTNDPWGSVTAKLDGVNYTIETHWNTRAAAWFFDVLNEDGDVLKAGIKIVVSWPLCGWRETDPDMMPGVITAIDTSGAQEDPTLDDLGTRVLLVYGETT